MKVLSPVRTPPRADICSNWERIESPLSGFSAVMVKLTGQQLGKN